MSRINAAQATAISRCPDFTLKFHNTFFQATPHLSDAAVLVFTKKVAESAKDKVLIQVDADTYLDISPAPKWQAFCDHLETTGQLDPIIVDQQGYVLDGFATWFALSMMKVAAKDILTKVITHHETDEEKITWIRSRKLGRANLTESQRMELVKAEIKDHPERGNNLQAQLLGVDHKTVAKYRQELEALGPKNGGIKWYDKLLGAKGRKDDNPGKNPSADSKGKPRSGKRRAATTPISLHANETAENVPVPTAEETPYCPRSADEEDWEKQDDGWHKDGYRIFPQKDGKCQVFKGKELIAEVHSEDEALAVVDQDIDEEPDDLEQEPNGDNEQSQRMPPPRSITLADEFGVSFDADNSLWITEKSGYIIHIEAKSLSLIEQIEAALKEYRRGK